MQDFQGRVAVVTGAASGIGFASATRFAEEELKVVLADIQQDALDAAVTTLQNAGHPVIGVLTDVSKYDQIKRLAEHAITDFNDFWILTHPAWKTVVQERVAGLVENRLVSGFGG